MFQRGPGGSLHIYVFWRVLWTHSSKRTILSTVKWTCLVCADPVVLESRRLIRPGLVIMILLQNRARGDVNGVVYVSDLSALSSPVVLHLFSFFGASRTSAPRCPRIRSFVLKSGGVCGPPYHLLLWSDQLGVWEHRGTTGEKRWRLTGEHQP